MAPTLTVAGYPPRGRGVATRYGLDAELIVAIGSVSETGFDTNYALADRLLPSLLDASAARKLTRGYAEVVVALRSEPVVDDGFDEDQPSMTALVASCASGSVELSWVGNDKAYLVRERRVLAETEEHTLWRRAGAPVDRVELRPLAKAEAGAKKDAPRRPSVSVDPLTRNGRIALGCPTRRIDRRGCEPQSLDLRGVEAGDRLILMSSRLHTRVSWRSGVELALARVKTLDASSLHRALGEVAVGLDPELALDWTGPLVVVAFC